VCPWSGDASLSRCPGGAPDVAIEIVSNRKGDELGRKKRGYARMRILYYAVWDPIGLLGALALHGFELRGDLFPPQPNVWFEAAGLGLREWCR
jgi:Uma2 family endonuclease